MSWRGGVYGWPHLLAAASCTQLRDPHHRQPPPPSARSHRTLVGRRARHTSHLPRRARRTKVRGSQLRRALTDVPTTHPSGGGGGRASRGCSSPAAFSRWVASPLYAYIQPYTAIACRAIERAAYLRVAICPAPLSRISFLWFSYPALSSAGPSSHHRRHPPPPASGCLSVLSPPPARISRCLGNHRRFALTRARDYRPHRPCLRSAAAAGPVVAADGARCLRCVVGG